MTERLRAVGQGARPRGGAVAGLLVNLGLSAASVLTVLLVLEVACRLSEEELNTYLRRLGPLGRVLEDTAEPLRTRVIQTVRAAFDPYLQGDEVRFDAACWVVGARASVGLT